jgi:hypothetical protein
MSFLCCQDRSNRVGEHRGGCWLLKINVNVLDIKKQEEKYQGEAHYNTSSCLSPGQAF